MIPINISIRGRTCGCRWYPRPDRISIFVNKIAENIDPDDPMFDLAIGITFLHEYVHVKFFRGGCKRGSECRSGNCFYCNVTYKILEYLK